MSCGANVLFGDIWEPCPMTVFKKEPFKACPWYLKFDTRLSKGAPTRKSLRWGRCRVLGVARSRSGKRSQTKPDSWSRPGTLAHQQYESNYLMLSWALLLMGPFAFFRNLMGEFAWMRFRTVCGDSLWSRFTHNPLSKVLVLLHGDQHKPPVGCFLLFGGLPRAFFGRFAGASSRASCTFGLFLFAC